MSIKNDNAAIINALSSVLADSYLLYLKTQNFHWNITGPQFASLHSLFQTQYEDLAVANDDIAERIRALGALAPGSFAAFSQMAKISEAGDAPLSATEMLETLAADQDVIAATAEEAMKLAQETGDEATADLMIQRITTHQKNRWMLKAHLES
ncbi:MAG: DNA starvation/stationary phase protection protein [Alphaproteobacteria bacterium]|nr:DNA starvation/stationary phase protection protein [Alphaproteobacteria bacterium]